LNLKTIKFTPKCTTIIELVTLKPSYSGVGVKVLKY